MSRLKHLTSQGPGEEGGEACRSTLRSKASQAAQSLLPMSQLALCPRRLGAAASSASMNLGQYWQCLHSLSELFILPFPIAPLDLL